MEAHQGTKVNDGEVAELATGLSREKLNELKNLAVSAENGALVYMPEGVLPSHFVPELFEFLGCHTNGPGKLVYFTYPTESGMGRVACPLGYLGGSDEVVDGEPLESDEPPAPLEDEVVQPMEGGTEDCPAES
jgi:hypothetical protein